jgi:hypothetical protein
MGTDPKPVWFINAPPSGHFAALDWSHAAFPQVGPPRLADGFPEVGRFFPTPAGRSTNWFHGIYNLFFIQA